MSEVPITYAVVGGPPDNWNGLRIFDIDTGLEVHKVVEANTAEGWLIKCKLNAEGEIYAEGDEVATERVEGRFIIIPPVGVK